MAVSKKAKKVLQRGKKESLVGLLKRGREIVRDASSRNKKQYKLPTSKLKVGKVTHAVEFGLVTITFPTKRDALAFQKLLSRSVEKYPSDIVRREITDEGFYLQ